MEVGIVKIIKKIKNSELLRGSAIALFFRALGIVSQYLFIFLLARFYGAETVGIFSLTFIILQFSGILGRLGTDSAILKFSAEYKSKHKWSKLRRVLNDAYLITTVTSCLISFFVYHLAEHISIHIFNKAHIASYIRIISLGIMPFSLLFVNFEFLRGLKKIALYVGLQSGIPYSMATLFLILGIFYDMDESIIFFGIILAFGITFLISLFFANRSFPLNESEQDRPMRNQLLSYALPLMIASSVSYLSGWFDTIVLGNYWTESDVGIYSICLKIGIVISIPLVAVNSISAPKFAEHWGNNDIEKLQKVAQDSTNLIFFSSLPILLIIFLFPTTILNLFGTEFIKGKTALLIIAIAQFINAMSGSVGLLLQMTKYQKVFQNIILLAVCLNIVLSFILIPKFGIVGAAIATSICLIFWNVTSVLFVRKEIGFWITNLKDVLKRLV